MTVAPEVTTTDDATFTAGNSAASRPPRPALTGRHVEKIFTKSAALVAATAVIWLIVLAIITLVDDGLHANWR
jgi:ABC-type uncharacterized transport system fused permease/ATPase subunit